MEEERSLNSVRTTFSPSLVFPHGKKFTQQTFFTLSDGLHHQRSVPELRRMCFLTCSHGWLLLLHYYEKNPTCYLFNPVSLKKIHLPPITTTPFTHHYGVISDDPNNNNNFVVMIINRDTKSFIFCRPRPRGGDGDGDDNNDGTTNSSSYTWFQQDLVPNSHQNENSIRGIRSPMSYNGKVYMLCYEGLIVVDVNNLVHNNLAITIHQIPYPKKSIPNICLFYLFLVESCGDIFFVWKLHLGITIDIQTLDVFKLDLSSMVWVKVETLGDRIFLLGDGNCISISATQLGHKHQGDCMYFFEQNDTSLYKFDMRDGSITVTRPCPNVVRQWDPPYWLVPEQLPLPCSTGNLCQLVPSDNLLGKQEMTKVDETNEQGSNGQCTLMSLPKEIQEFIISLLYLGDFVRFRLTCKTWFSLPSPLRSTHFLMQSNSKFEQPPWLMSIPKNNLRCKFHIPIYDDTYYMDIPELDSAVIHHSKYGWLLMSRPDSSFFFFSPYTRKTIELPALPAPYYRPFMGISFSAPPTSSDCIIFGHQESHSTFVEMLVYRHGEHAWHLYHLPSTVPFIASHCHPVFCDGLFYCLDCDGKLGVFNAADGLEQELVWRVLPNLIGPNMTIYRCFIVEYDGQILSVFMGRLGTPICVYKLDRCKKKWVKIENLGDKVLFLSHTTSILAPARLKGIENKIFLPIRSTKHRKKSMFYSLETGRYHSVGSKESCEDWIDTCKERQSTWIEEQLD